MRIDCFTRQAILPLAVGLSVGAAFGIAAGQQSDILFSRNGETLRVLKSVDLGNVAAGRYTLRMAEYSMQPGSRVSSHVHLGPGLRYVLQGTIAIEYRKGDAIKTQHMGSTYFEPAGPHYGGYNASSGRTRVLITELMPVK